MKKTVCDKCGKELKDNEAIELEVGGKTLEYFDLCEDCREALINWLAGICPCKVTKEAEEETKEDPMYDGPKNDKVGYSANRLEAMLHKGRVTIKAALAAMGIEAAKWIRNNQLKIRYYLGEAEMKELKKRLGVK